MLFKRIFKSKKPVNNIGISSSKQSVQIPNIHEIALKRAFFVYYDDKFSHIHRYACGESGIDEAIHDAIKGMEISKEEIISVKSELMDILDISEYSAYKIVRRMKSIQFFFKKIA